VLLFHVIAPEYPTLHVQVPPPPVLFTGQETAAHDSPSPA
jgi:hypothetical protein